MSDFYTPDEASQFLSIPRKYLDNYIKVGAEMTMSKSGRKNVISKTIVEQWRNQREFSGVTLNREDYLKCLEFAIRSFYAYRSTSDFGTSTQRDAGKFISNFIIGKLGEIAVEKFLTRNFDVLIHLDFDLREAVVGQDITEIARPRRGGRVFNPLRRRVAIKTSKLKNVWLIVPEKEVTDPERTSDIYIFCRVELVLDHLIRILKGHESLERLRSIIPDFEDIPAEVCGFVEKDSLTSEPPTKMLPIQNQEIGLSYIKRTGELLKNRADWDTILSTL